MRHIVTIVSVSRPAPADRVAVEEGDDGFVLRQTITRVHRLNPTASVVFALCDGTRTTDTIIDLVQAAWGLDESPRDAVIACLAQLRAEGLIA